MGTCHQGTGNFSGHGRMGTNSRTLSALQDWHRLSCGSQQQAAPCPIWRVTPPPQLSLASTLGCSLSPLQLGAVWLRGNGSICGRDTEKVGTREARNGMKGKYSRDKAGARHRFFEKSIGESHRYISLPTCQMCRKCAYFWKSPLGQGACDKQNNIPQRCLCPKP